MKILVPVKRVVDFNIKPQVKDDGSGVDTAGLKMSMNPFDEIAVEEALRLREKGVASEVNVISIGVPKCQDTLRTALGMGADNATLVHTEEQTEPLSVAKILQKIVEKEGYKLVILGKQAIDDDMSATGQMLAGLLGWSQGTFVSKVDVSGDKLVIHREVDGGSEELSLTLPAVLTADLRLNEPRYTNAMNLFKARKKPIEKIEASELGVSLTPRLQTVSVAPPTERKAGEKLNSVSELLDKLRNEAKVL